MTINGEKVTQVDMAQNRYGVDVAIYESPGVYYIRTMSAASGAIITETFSRSLVRARSIFNSVLEA